MPPETRYTILLLQENLEAADIVGTVDAYSADQAIRRHVHEALAADAPSGVAVDGTYVAIPARSWNPVKVAAQVQTTIKIEEAR